MLQTNKYSVGRLRNYPRIREKKNTEHKSRHKKDSKNSPIKHVLKRSINPPINQTPHPPPRRYRECRTSRWTYGGRSPSTCPSSTRPAATWRWRASSFARTASFERNARGNAHNFTIWDESASIFKLSPFTRSSWEAECRLMSENHRRRLKVEDVKLRFLVKSESWSFEVYKLESCKQIVSCYLCQFVYIFEGFPRFWYFFLENLHLSSASTLFIICTEASRR